MKIRNVKGGYDFLPKEQKIRNYITKTLTEVFREYGYNPIETPILCYYDMLSDKYDVDDDILNEIYKLEDQGKRKLGLRYDLTVPFAKFIALNKNNIKMPFKRYEIAKAFRDGPVKVGRDREFTQCDVDVVGIKGELIEAELLTMYKRAFEKLEIEIIIEYNSRNLLTGIILESGIDKYLVSKVTTIIDKIKKITKVEFINLLKELNLNDKNINNLIENLDLTLEDLNNKYKNTTNQTLQKGLTEVTNLSNYIKILELDNICKFNLSLSRGQNYYTGNVFEVYEKNRKITGSIAAGGRYDKMITNFINDGNEYPAVGISFGLSSIYELVKERETLNFADIDIYIIPIENKIYSINIANKIRSLGIRVEVDYTNNKLKKSLDYANKMKIPYVIIIGEDEINNGKIILKDMINRENYTIKIDNISDIKKYIKYKNML